MSGGRSSEARRADRGDVADLARLVDQFNREFGDPTPGPEALAVRLGELLEDDTEALVIGPGPDGFAILRYRRSLVTANLECYLAELYVVPERRGHGLGRALMSAVLTAARRRGADYIELNTSEDDRAARALYESLGFVNRERPPDGPVIYYYERDLRDL